MVGISHPAINEHLEALGAASTAFGRLPACWRHPLLQQLLHRPAVVCQTCRHRQRSLHPASQPQTAMVRADVVHHAHQVHPLLHCRLLPSQPACLTGQARQARPEGRVEPFNIGGAHHLAACRRAQPARHRCATAAHQAPQHPDGATSRLPSCTTASSGQTIRRGAPRGPVRCGVRNTRRHAVG